MRTQRARHGGVGVPIAPLKPCPAPGCPKLVERGRCAAHARQVEQHRGSARQRGYTTAWDHFRTVTFPRLLIRADIPIVCGASLPGGPPTAQFSDCAKAGVLEDRNLHLDHEPPLTEGERTRGAAVCDPGRVGYLCARCHARKTRLEQAARL